MSNLLSIRKNVYLFKSSYWNINSGLLLNEEGGTVIDPAYSPLELRQMADFIKDNNLPQKYLIYTHSDFDHITGEPYFPDAVKISQGNFRYCSRQTQMAYLKEADKAHEIERSEFVFPLPDITFEDRLNLDLKDEKLSLFAAPGHTSDSIFVLLNKEKILFSGDTVSDLEFPLIFDSGKKYGDSLRLLQNLIKEYDINYVIPGHGTPAEGREEILERIKYDLDYLENLVCQIEDCFYQGLATMEIMSFLKELRYKGDYIDADLMPVHIKNIETVLNEL